MSIPSWSVTAALGDPQLAGCQLGDPIAVVEAGVVKECSPSARAEGVRPGMRRREAHAACPGVRLIAHSPERDRAVFDRVIVWLSSVIAQHTLLRPGLLAFQARGIVRFYGSEELGARALIDQAASYTPALEARIGIADDLFSAVIAATHAPPNQPWLSVPPGGSAQFLAQYPVSILGDDEAVSLLERLGVATVGQCAALGEPALRERFGATGQQLYRLATGVDPGRLSLTGPPVDPHERIDLPEPYRLVEQVAFAIRAATDDYLDRLGEAGYVCTRVGVEIVFDDETRHERVWVHPRFFTSGELVDRVRWQLEQCGRELSSDDEYPPGVVSVRYTAEDPEAQSAHEPGLWGQGPDPRVHQVFSRIQGLVGSHGVLLGRGRPGRHAAQTQKLTAWGDAPEADPPGPLPGSLPRPLPATVFAAPHSIDLQDAQGRPVFVQAGALSGKPARIVGGTQSRPISAWAGPWPVATRWWEGNPVRYRLQVLDEQGMGWLLGADEESRWSIDARYD